MKYDQLNMIWINAVNQRASNAEAAEQTDPVGID
jgi:hypothetical protein